MSAQPPSTPIPQLATALEALATEPTRRVFGVGVYRDACREAAGALRWLLEQLRASELRAAQKSGTIGVLQAADGLETARARLEATEARQRAERAEAEADSLRQALVDSRHHSERLAAVSTVSLLADHERQAAAYAVAEAAELRQKVAVLEQELAALRPLVDRDVKPE